MSNYSEAGKGSAPRKTADQEKYAKNYEKIFSGGWLEKKKLAEEAAKKETK